MLIELHEMPIQSVVNYSKHLKKCQGFTDKEEEGVYGMNGRLNIRPPYQREFIYDDAKRKNVIKTVRRNLTLNSLYFVENKDGSYEVLDGQQRLISICQYVSGVFSFDKKYFNNLTDDQQDQILNFPLEIKVCTGTNSEKLEWFKIINVAGETQSDQEIRNATFYGSWTYNAKRYFSRRGCPAYQVFGDYMKGNPLRQNYLETAIKWISNGEIENYMAEHQHDENAEELWNYFENVVEWTKKTFSTYREGMQGLPFGEWYNKYKDTEFDSEKIEKEIQRLIEDDEVENRNVSGIYKYIIERDEKYLNLRTFSPKQKRGVYEKQQGKCAYCGEHFDIDDMEADHIDPWSKGGKTIIENCQILCRPCNRRKGNK